MSVFESPYESPYTKQSIDRSTGHGYWEPYQKPQPYSPPYDPGDLRVPPYTPPPVPGPLPPRMPPGPLPPGGEPFRMWRPPMPDVPGGATGGKWVYDKMSGQWVWASEPVAPSPIYDPGDFAATDTPVTTQPISYMPNRPDYRPPQRVVKYYWDPHRSKPQVNIPSQDMINQMQYRRNSTMGYWDPSRASSSIAYNPPPQDVLNTMRNRKERWGYWDPYRGSVAPNPPPNMTTQPISTEVY